MRRREFNRPHTIAFLCRCLAHQDKLVLVLDDKAAARASQSLRQQEEGPERPRPQSAAGSTSSDPQRLPVILLQRHLMPQHPRCSILHTLSCIAALEIHVHGWAGHSPNLPDLGQELLYGLLNVLGAWAWLSRNDAVCQRHKLHEGLGHTLARPMSPVGSADVNSAMLCYAMLLGQHG